MINLKIEIPTTQDEFDVLSLEQKKNILDDMNMIKEKFDDFIVKMVEERIAPILIKNPLIEDLALDPKYEYNDEGYAPTYIMPFINGEYYLSDDSGDELFEKIDYACADIANLITFDIGIDVQEVKARYAAKCLDEKLPKKKSQSKRFKT